MRPAQGLGEGGWKQNGVGGQVEMGGKEFDEPVGQPGSGRGVICSQSGPDSATLTSSIWAAVHCPGEGEYFPIPPDSSAATPCPRLDMEQACWPV